MSKLSVRTLEMLFYIACTSALVYSRWGWKGSFILFGVITIETFVAAVLTHINK